MVRIGYIGPGRMGCGIIANLLKNNLEVVIFRHRRSLNLKSLQDLGAKPAYSLRQLAAECDTIMLTVPSSIQVEQAILERDGLLDNLRPGSVVIDSSTSLPSSTRMLAARLAKKRIEMLDAPMTRGPQQAAEGRLNLMVGGRKKIYQRYLPIFQMLAENIFYVGGIGCGHTVKLINNFLGQMNNAAIAEILPLAAKSGVDLDALFALVSVSGGNSATFQRHVPSILQRKFDVLFALKLCHKDIHYMSRMGLECNMALPMVNSTAGVLDLALAAGMGDRNADTLVQFWEKLAGVKVKSACRTSPNDGLKKSP